MCHCGALFFIFSHSFFTGGRVRLREDTVIHQWLYPPYMIHATRRLLPCSTILPPPPHDARHTERNATCAYCWGESSGGHRRLGRQGGVFTRGLRCVFSGRARRLTGVALTVALAFARAAEYTWNPIFLCFLSTMDGRMEWNGLLPGCSPAERVPRCSRGSHPVGGGASGSRQRGVALQLRVSAP
jgi:hypothetical protein